MSDPVWPVRGKPVGRALASVQASTREWPTEEAGSSQIFELGSSVQATGPAVVLQRADVPLQATLTVLARSLVSTRS